jgi:hypothetical protein
VPLKLGIVGDVGDTLDELATPRQGAEPLHPQFVARLIDELLNLTKANLRQVF